MNVEDFLKSRAKAKPVTFEVDGKTIKAFVREPTASEEMEINAAQLKALPFLKALGSGLEDCKTDKEREQLVQERISCLNREEQQSWRYFQHTYTATRMADKDGNRLFESLDEFMATRGHLMSEAFYFKASEIAPKATTEEAEGNS